VVTYEIEHDISQNLFLFHT